jgi:hypothetical protein
LAGFLEGAIPELPRGTAMKARIGLVAVAVAVAAVGYLATRDSEASRREAFITRCNEEGAGGMFTSREYCEELYARSTGKGQPVQNSN